jgi:hypothetical protein
MSPDITRSLTKPDQGIRAFPALMGRRAGSVNWRKHRRIALRKLPCYTCASPTN